METNTYEDRIVGEVFVDDDNDTIYYETIYDTWIDTGMCIFYESAKDDKTLTEMEEDVTLTILTNQSNHRHRLIERG